MKLLSSLVLSATLLLVGSTAGFGQASHTWISGLGDDSQPGSRTFPCKTVAGAYSKTAAGGEIDVLSSGGFGGLTISKSLTIDGRGSLSSVLVSGTNGITIDGGTGTPVVVTIRNFAFDGVGAGLTGVKVTGNVVVRLVNCQIFGFTGAAVDFQGADASALYLDNCQIHDCAGGGVLLEPTSAGTPPVQGNTTAKLEGVSISRCGTAGVSNKAGSTAYLHNVDCKNINGPAFSTATGTKATISHCTASLSSSGIAAGGIVLLSDSEIIANTGAGLSTTTGGGIYTPRNNHVAGNSPDGSASGNVALQ